MINRKPWSIEQFGSQRLGRTSLLYDPIAWLPSNFTDACDIHHKKQKKNKSREERERESETERIEVLMILIPKKIIYIQCGGVVLEGSVGTPWSCQVPKANRRSVVRQNGDRPPT